ncbi:MAG: kelch repeat-containing protein, partial [Rhodospirillales bacterium]|nr:kelch repeat-containing protein [Rhodospirillales bacterium]
MSKKLKLALAAALLFTTVGGAAAQTVPSPENKGRWMTKAPVPTTRTEVSVAELDGKLWLIGGYVLGSVTSNLLQSYDPKTDTWSDHANMPIGVNHVNVVGHKGKIYAFGGFIKQNAHPIANSYAYDVATNRWQEIAPLPFARGASSVVVLGDKIHVIGGAVGGEGGAGIGSGPAAPGVSIPPALQRSGTPPFNPNPPPPPKGARTSITDHDIYDPATNTWSKAAGLPVRRDHIATVVYDGKIHAIGGRMENFFQNTTLHNVYDPATDAWGFLARLPTARSGASAAVLDGLIVVIGGEGSSEKGVYAENEAYDPKTDTWRTLAPMSVP